MPSLRDSCFEGYGLPTTEVVGYYLPSLPGLNSHLGLTRVFFRPCRDSIGARGSSRFLSSLPGLDRSALLISELTVLLLTFDTCGVVREMRTISARQATSPALTTATSRGGRPPRPPRPPVHPSTVSTPSTASTASSRKQECRRDACAAKRKPVGQTPGDSARPPSGTPSIRP